MDLSILIGIVAGFALIVMGIVTASGQLIAFWDVASVFIVLGGTLASTLVHYPWKRVRNVVKLLRIAMTDSEISAAQTIRLLVYFAEKARREGLLAIEDEAQNVDDEFLRNGLQLVVDGIDPELVRNMLEIELAFLEQRHQSGQGMFEHMASVAPAFGMVGTLIGLIIMLGNLDDPNVIGPGLAVALITTFYGVVVANLILMPIAGKLRLRSEEEVLIKEVMMEGILSIQAGENPAIVEQKLKAFLPPSMLEEPDSQADAEDEMDELADREGVMSGAR